MISNPYAEKISKKKQNFRKVFPPLANRAKDSFLKDPLMNEKLLNLSDYETSSVCKFFNHEEGKLTARTTTRSTKYTSSMPKHPMLSQSLSYESHCIWELTERIDSYILRSTAKQFSKSLQHYIDQIDLGTQCFNDILAILKLTYPELYPIFSSFIENLFKVFEDFVEFHKNSISMLNKNIGGLEEKIENLGKDYKNLNEEYERIIKVKKVEDMQIEEEVKKLFPEGPHPLVSLKEKLIEVNKIRPQGVCQILSELFNEMNKERKIPSLTEINFEELDSSLFVDKIKGNYEVVVSSTIKSIQKAYKNTFTKTNSSVQTVSVYIDPKNYEELAKQLDKTSIAFQSSLMQVEKLKEDLKNAHSNINKLEYDKNQLKTESQNIKLEVDYKSKEIYNLKFELESKKNEIVILQKQISGKTKDFEYFEKKFYSLESENQEMKANLNNTNKTIEEHENPPLVIRRNIENEETSEKKSRLDEITASGLTVRNELEKLYGNTLLRGNKASSNIAKPENSAQKVPKPENLPRESPEKQKKLVKNYEKSEEDLSHDFETESKIENVKEDITPKIKLKTEYLNTIKSEEKPSTNLNNSLQSPKKKTVKKKKNTNTAKIPISHKNSSKEIEKSEAKKVKTKNLPENRTADFSSETLEKTRNTVEKEKNDIKENQFEDEGKEEKKEEEKEEEKNFGMQDKCCGKDIEAEVSIGIQVGDDEENNQDSPIAYKGIIRGFNPNNIYGLKADIYYQKSVFQPQSRIPDLTLPHQHAYKFETNAANNS